ncbi:unnamed protein product [Dibothriocephalus latus]|uniref:Protein kinase domain-containing protein n=1 Tax=Dibothriocephalus latus TaxID=60516 RepID=A0A3P7LVL1_DIBLA|nr:unnamed protein product [Dibothriocephalus latus]
MIKNVSTTTTSANISMYVQKSIFEGEDAAVKSFPEMTDITKRYKELDMLLRLNHPNILTAYAAGPDIENGSLDFIVTEYASCGDLNDLIHNSIAPYNLSNALSWMLQLSRAVAYLHYDCEPKIIHRDIKPANLFLFNQGRVLKVGDFGSAGVNGLTSPTRRGTWAYMAPELFGSHTVYDSKADVYSWAITFWEILARRFPSPPNEPFIITVKNIVVEKRRPPTLSECPSVLQALLSSAWSEDPEARPNMSEIAAFLQFVEDSLISSGLLPSPMAIEALSSRRLTGNTDANDDLVWEGEEEEQQNTCVDGEGNVSEWDFCASRQPSEELVVCEPECSALPAPTNFGELNIVCDADQ